MLQLVNVFLKIMCCTTRVVTLKLKPCLCNSLWRNSKFVMLVKRTRTKCCVFRPILDFTVLLQYSKLEEIEEDDSQRANREAAQAEEEQLRLTPEARLLVERKLAAMQLEPGGIDGSFDRDTRRAIRRYQRSRDLPVTGFLTRQTAVRLFSE